MYTDYIRWQFVVGPGWLLSFAIRLMQALQQIFSVRLMLRTLVAHWHKDAVPYRPGTLSNYAMTFAWNTISRGIGFSIRSTVLAVWLMLEIALAALSAASIILFLLWPLLIIIAAAAGMGMLAAGQLR